MFQFWKPIKVLTSALVAVSLTAAMLTGAVAQGSHADDSTSKSGSIWRVGSNTFWIVPCTGGDADAVTVEARKDGRATRANTCYMSRDFVSVIWSRAPWNGGPDVIVLGQSGGSAACGDVIGITFDLPPVLHTLSFCPAERVPIVLMRNLPEFDASLDVEGFNGGSATNVAVGNVAVMAHQHGFAADLNSMVAAPLTADERQHLRSIMVTDLHQWAVSRSGAGPTAPSTPDTVEALLNLVLSGRADEARTLLFEAGDAGVGPAFRAEAFWDDLCLAIVAHPL